MDIPRPEFRRQRTIKTVVYSSAVGIALIGATLALSRLEPAAPSVPRASVWIDTVREGEMLRRVRGPGNLVPREMRWVAAQTTGRVERVLIRPGALVEPETIIVEMSNPELMQQAEEAKFQLDGTEADLIDTELRIKSQQLDQRNAVEVARGDYEAAQLRVEVARQLYADNAMAELDYRLSELSVKQLERRLAIAEERLSQLAETMDAQLSSARARISQARNLYQRRLDQIESLKIRAGVDGVLQEIQVEEGQQVTLGSNIARVARPDDLQAELRIPETQARDVQIGQRVEIDTRNGLVNGFVTRIDPAAQSGTVQVDVELHGELPRGARPQLSVDGTIEIERLDRVVYTGRPAYGQADATISLFKLDPDGEYATRIPVQLGRTSVNEVEIIQGLVPGDEVILSDTSSWDDYERIQLD
jgi:HlyD family secretion protein